MAGPGSVSGSGSGVREEPEPPPQPVSKARSISVQASRSEERGFRWDANRPNGSNTAEEYAWQVPSAMITISGRPRFGVQFRLQCLRPPEKCLTFLLLTAPVRLSPSCSHSTGRRFKPLWPTIFYIFQKLITTYTCRLIRSNG